MNLLPTERHERTFKQVVNCDLEGTLVLVEYYCVHRLSTGANEEFCFGRDSITFLNKKRSDRGAVRYYSSANTATIHLAR